MSYFTEHPELLDGLPEHWKSFSDRDWFPYVVGALARPDERMRKQLLTEIGQPDMPERVWQFAVSSFMLVLTYKWPPVTMSDTEDAWRLFRQHLIQTYEDDLASHDDDAPQPVLSRSKGYDDDDSFLMERIKAVN